MRAPWPASCPRPAITNNPRQTAISAAWRGRLFLVTLITLYVRGGWPLHVTASARRPPSGRYRSKAPFARGPSWIESANRRTERLSVDPRHGELDGRGE